jgi:hypothetical protein
MSEYDFSESNEESLHLRIEETATDVSSLDTGPSLSPIRKKKKRVLRPMSPASESESESILTKVQYIFLFVCIFQTSNIILQEKSVYEKIETRYCIANVGLSKSACKVNFVFIIIYRITHIIHQPHTKGGIIVR